METSSSRVHVGFTIIICLEYRFVCITPQFSNECLCFLVPRSKSLGRRCLFFLLEGIQTLYFLSRFQFVRQNHNEAQGGGSFRCFSLSTLVANSTLVSTASQIIRPTSYPSASVEWNELLTLPQEDFLHPLKDGMRLARGMYPG